MVIDQSQSVLAADAEKENRKSNDQEETEILKLAPRKYKDCNMNAPKLNEEIKSNLKEDAAKRDGYFYNYQNMIGSSLALTASVLSMILNDKSEPINRKELLQSLSDAVKMNAELFHSWTVARKIYITPAFDKKIKTILDKVEPTEFLFGDNVKELVQNVKIIEKVGKDLKSTVPKKPFKGNNALNFRGSSGKEVNQMNQGRNNYYTSRSGKFNQRKSRSNWQHPQQRQYTQPKQYTQTQPMQPLQDQQRKQ